MRIGAGSPPFASAGDAGHAAEPGGVTHPAGEGPAAGHVITAVPRRGVALSGPPGEDGAGVVSPDLAGDGWVEERGGHGAAVSLAEAPGGAAVDFRDRFDYGHVAGQRHFGAAEAPGQQHAEQPRFVQRVEQGGRQPPRALGLVRRRADRRGDAFDIGDDGLGGARLRRRHGSGRVHARIVTPRPQARKYE